jgi:hypothetical protein
MQFLIDPQLPGVARLPLLSLLRQRKEAKKGDAEPLAATGYPSLHAKSREVNETRFAQTAFALLYPFSAVQHWQRQSG